MWVRGLVSAYTTTVVVVVVEEKEEKEEDEEDEEDERQRGAYALLRRRGRGLDKTASPNANTDTKLNSAYV